MEQLDALVVGAGIAGLVVAKRLKSTGLNVVCVDKARGTGGRLSSKKVETSSGEAIAFDLGCTDFNAVTVRFQQQVKDWLEEGVVAEMSLQHAASSAKRYVGIPRSSALTRHLATSLDIRFGARVSRIERDGNYWVVYLQAQPGQPDSAAFRCAHVVLAIPPVQAAGLLPGKHRFKELLSEINMLPQWVVMLATKGSAPQLGDDQIASSDVIARYSHENKKPGRGSDFVGDIWQIQATPSWTERHLEATKESVIAQLTAEFKRCMHSELEVVASYAHRWLYSRRGARVVAAQDCLSSDDGMHACGDYLCNDPRFEGVEAAYTSAVALAEHVLSLS